MRKRIVERQNNLFLLSFIVIFISQLFWATLPAAHWLAIAVGLIALATLISCRIPVWKSSTKRLTSILLIGCLAGFFWGGSVGHWYKRWQLSGVEFQQDVTIAGRITAIQHDFGSSRLSVDVFSVNDSRYTVSRHFRVNWYRPAVVANVGDNISATIRLKPPRGLGNPHAFDYEKWLVANNIVATGYIKHKTSTVITRQPISVRQSLITQVMDLELKNARWLAALSLGDRQAFTDHDWQLLQHTGTAHLFAISGLHLSIVAGMFVALASALPRVMVSQLGDSKWLQGFLSRHQINFQPLVFFAALLLVTAYAYLAGWQIPVLRAWTALVLVTLLTIKRCRIAPSDALIGVVFVLALCVPYSIYSGSFWLSVGAVVVIVFMLWRWPQRPVGWRAKMITLLRFQCVLSVAMAPLIVAQFQFFSPWVIVINIVAVPLVTLVLVPLCLCATVLLTVHRGFAFEAFRLADGVMEAVLWIMHHADSLNVMKWEHVSFCSESLLCIAVAIFIALLPSFRGKRMLMSIWMLPVVAELSGPVLADESKVDSMPWQLHVFDAGQGTALAITRGQRAMLIDTGSAFDSGFSIANSAVIPFLRAQKITDVDTLVVSHGDNDHAGGTDTLVAAFPNMQVITQHECVAGQSWRWQQLSVKVLWPLPEWQQTASKSTNDASCVLIISDGHTQVMMPGDISRTSELAVLRFADSGWHQTPVQSDVLIAPHHGSNTSSSQAFVQAVSPKHVVYANGYQHRWGFPKPEVVARYDELEAHAWQSAEHGYIRFTISPHGSEIRVNTFRQDLSARWFR
ncbi:DNA internalization-related competence protein ComEC/Rec2 [Alteromonas oceanisediminis]|uniref:DNA internalization-related competence protein ComEC/Rec2 n=1 Tax=Alteromonas oceanisediminis TaxID=2836180 RepID=UPI001BD9F6EE|nr:DNA internalization-related competence protein ComEC/Rec2 [Alteromonas oceanisediminis]MBT0586502.1 DNA internalization-related competence protein ComEC/Rec2 [Alteromonas oceanisediminis]